MVKNISIRLDPSCLNRDWDIPNLLNKAGYFENIDSSSDKMLVALGKSRLCVCTHNATVFLETLVMNFPTIIFWNPSHYEIRSEAAPFFDLLVEAGILFYTPEAAAKKVNIVEHNVNEWWFSDQVQAARTEFCERYALTSSEWLEEWSTFLFNK